VELRAPKTLKDPFRVQDKRLSRNKGQRIKAALRRDVVSQNRLQYLLVARLLPSIPNLTLIGNSETSEVMNRPRTGRSTAARDSNRDPGESELETVKALAREGLLEAKKHNDKARELGLQIVTLEEEIKSKGSSKFKNPLSNVMLITWLL
jgi:hypothetical protein